MCSELKPDEGKLLSINEWLDAIGCDRAYKKDMKATYEKIKPELEAQRDLTAGEKDAWYNALLEEFKRVKIDRAKLIDEVKQKDAEIEELKRRFAHKLKDHIELAIAKAKKEERERMIKRLETWRSIGTHLISKETIKALKEGKEE